jgi:hypothetical protein
MLIRLHRRSLYVLGIGSIPLRRQSCNLIMDDLTEARSSRDDNPAVSPSINDSLNIEETGSKYVTVKGRAVALTSDEATEIALGTIEEEFTIDSDNSPYPEVRANVPNTDDVDLPVNTVRMWFLGIMFTMVYAPLIFTLMNKDQLTYLSWDLASINFSLCDTLVLQLLHLLHNY